MKRRSFIRNLICGTAAVAAVGVGHFIPANEVLGDYVDYVNFSDFALTADLDLDTLVVAQELALREHRIMGVVSHGALG